jgi:hypothetical protein
MQNPNKYWYIFVLCYIVGGVFIGSVIAEDLVFGLSFFIVPSGIAALIIYRATKPRTVKIGHAINIIFVISLCTVEFFKSAGDVTVDIREGCLTRNQAVKSSSLNDLEKAQFCSCFANDLTPAFTKEYLRTKLTFSDWTPFEHNPTLQAAATKAWENCGSQL